MKITATEIVLRVGLSASLAVGGYVKAYLYGDGYRDVPTIGPAFLLQASLSFALAVLILIGGPWWLKAVAAALAAGALVAIALSRTIGLFGFTERGWEPTPYVALAVIAEIVTLVLCAAVVIGARKTLATMWSRTRSSGHTA